MRQQTHIRYNAKFAYFSAVFANFCYPLATLGVCVLQPRPPVGSATPNAPPAAGSMSDTRGQQPSAHACPTVCARATRTRAGPAPAAEQRAGGERVHPPRHPSATSRNRPGDYADPGRSCPASSVKVLDMEISLQPRSRGGHLSTPARTGTAVPASRATAAAAARGAPATGPAGTGMSVTLAAAGSRQPRAPANFWYEYAILTHTSS